MKIILAMFSIIILGWSDVQLEKNLNAGFSIWKFGKNVKLCKSSGASKCYDLGMMYASGNGVKQDPFKAKIFLYNACKDSFRGACKQLNVKHHKGKDTKHYSNAEIFKRNQKLCEASDGSVCYDLGMMYASGNGVKQDQFHSKTFYEKSCNDGYTKGCRLLAMKYQRGRGVRRDHSKAKMFYKKACDGGDSMSCGLYKKMTKNRR